MSLDADAIVYDLEDAVAVEKKEEARANLSSFLQKLYDTRTTEQPIPYITVRVNCPITTSYGRDDMVAINRLSNLEVIKAVVLPKVSSAVTLGEVITTFTKPLPIWAMIETSQGVINVEEISQCGSVDAVVLGINDLTKDIKARFTNQSRIPLYYSMSKCIVAARAASKAVIDGVYMNINDSEGFKADCILGKSFGFDGKSLIHPNQILLANSIFSPSLEEVEYARRVVAAYEKAREEGKSLAVLDNKLIEHLHVIEAIATIRSFNESHRVV